MNCPHCRSTATSKRPHRSALGYRRFACRSCHRRFNERTGMRFLVWTDASSGNGKRPLVPT